MKEKKNKVQDKAKKKNKKGEDIDLPP